MRREIMIEQQWGGESDGMYGIPNQTLDQANELLRMRRKNKNRDLASKGKWLGNGLENLNWMAPEVNWFAHQKKNREWIMTASEMSKHPHPPPSSSVPVSRVNLIILTKAWACLISRHCLLLLINNPLLCLSPILNIQKIQLEKRKRRIMRINENKQ